MAVEDGTLVRHGRPEEVADAVAFLASVAPGADVQAAVAGEPPARQAPQALLDGFGQRGRASHVEAEPGGRREAEPGGASGDQAASLLGVAHGPHRTCPPHRSPSGARIGHSPLAV